MCACVCVGVGGARCGVLQSKAAAVRLSQIEREVAVKESELKRINAEVRCMM